MELRLTMMLSSSLFLIIGLLGMSAGQLPTVFEYYRPSENETQSGLTADADGFKLNEKLIRIASGSIHYFRVHPDYWRDRLKRLRASGANTLDTYIAWNLHEPEKNVFDFGDGNHDMSAFLNIRRFIEIAQEEDLLVILRPGPYICSEYEFGGFPSWLLRDPNMTVRSNYPGYLDRVKIYFDKLLPLFEDLLWKNGGPVVAFQIENEFGGFGTEEKEHLEALKEIILSNRINELLFTSDSPLSAGDKGAIPGVLQTANFRFNPRLQMDRLLELQPNMPILVAEFWSGWFDYWLQDWHSTEAISEFNNTLNIILEEYDGSVNFYMFHGGTDYNFLNGANTFPGIFPFYRPMTTSYDYNSPLSESGRYTGKYMVIRELLEKYQLVELNLPEMPAENPRTAYQNLTLSTYLSFNEIVNQVPEQLKTMASHPMSMEELPINNDSGQSYGYTVYRTKAVLQPTSTINIGRVRDEAIVLIDGMRVSEGAVLLLTGLLTRFGYWMTDNQTFTLALEPQDTERTVDLLVENWGRVNFGNPAAYHQKKGLFDQIIRIDETEVEQLEIIPLEFKSAWLKSLTGFLEVTSTTDLKGPVLVQSSFTIDEEPQDTFLDMSGWYKGIVFVNGFNIGRYYKAGPTQTMYVPAPFLRSGINTITIFESFEVGPQIVFTDQENLGPILV